MRNKRYIIGIVGTVLTLLCSLAVAQDSFVAEAKRYTAKVSKPKPPWDGPTTGPRAQRGKSIIYVSNDQRNGGAKGVSLGAAEAAKAIGWNFRLIDGQGTEHGRKDALKQALDLKPDGIILGNIDAQSQVELIREIAAKGIKIIGWHSAGKPGPIGELPVITNISTDPAEVGKVAAMYAVADSNGTAAVVIFTSDRPIGHIKKNAVIETFSKCQGCSVLQTETIDMKDTHNVIPQRTSLLLKNFGKKWTYSIAANDLYFDAMPPTFIAAAIPGNGYPKNISAGDGSEPAYERIRKNSYQVGTVAEPLRLHGWQAIDELNRAFAGQKNSGYSTSVHLVTSANIKFDGGKRSEFDPDNGYRDKYKKIWGVK